MRTRIALGAATTLAALIMTMTVAWGAGSAAAASRAHAIHHHWRHHARSTLARPSTVSAFLHARAVRMKHELAVYRKAHPLPVPPPVVAAAVAPAPPPPPPPPPPITDHTSTTTSTWACIRFHESSDRYNTPTVPGGAYGFLENTWLSLGYSGWPYQAPYSVQSQAALYLYNELGWQPWSTRFVCGL